MFLGEIDPDFQAKLLRVLQERTLQRVGGSEQRSVDVRVVAATNRELRADVAAGRFREDLCFRLAVIAIHLPPLRERPEDVLPLARHFPRALESAPRAPRHRLRCAGVEERLQSHAWRGNVRELENAIERGVVLASGDRLELDDLLLDEPSEGDAARAGGELQAFLDQAARQLGIDRTTLYA